MSQRNGFNWILCGGFVALNLVGFGLTHQRRLAETEMRREMMELRARRSDALEEWHLEESIPINTPACQRALGDLKRAEEALPVIGASPLSMDELSADVSRDLTKAIHGLMSAYRTGTPKALINYMESRGETLDEQCLAKLVDYLIENHGFKPEEVEQLSRRQQFEMSWDAFGIDPTWRALVASHSSITLWDCDKTSADTLSRHEGLDGGDVKLWRRRGIRYHNFSNSDDRISDQSETSGVKVADVRMLIKHKGKGARSICPYSVRFWYSDARKQWVPHLMVQFKTSSDITHRLMF